MAGKTSRPKQLGKATPLPGFDVRDRGAKSLSSPAVGDLDGDGRPEIIVATNEEYGQEPNSFAIESNLLRSLQLLLANADVDEFSLDTNGRVYAIHPDGTNHAGGAFLPGWPAKVPLLKRNAVSFCSRMACVSK